MNLKFNGDKLMMLLPYHLFSLIFAPFKPQTIDRMQQHTIHIAGGVARNPLVRLSNPVTLDFLDGEHIAIAGPNGAGKSLLVDLLTGKYPLRDGTLAYDFHPSTTQTVYDNIRYIAFRDTYGSADANYYYQQRWNAHDQEDAPLVRDLLGEVKDESLRQQLFELFRIEPMLGKKVILLSSGELRKFQLTKTLLTAPRVLIMDNPFIGLDAATRELLYTVLEKLAQLASLQIVLVLSMLDDIPSFITHVVPVDNKTVGEKMSRVAYLQAFREQDALRAEADAASLGELQQRIAGLPYENTNFTSDEVVRLNKVSIRYGDRTILKELDWTVMRGQKWALSGENGAGKSTLLSLVCADNPQSYACDIRLFGRKRGTGESIWEIKKHIGYVSPEMLSEKPACHRNRSFRTARQHRFVQTSVCRPDGCVRVVDGYFRCGAFERQAFPATVQRRAAPCLAGACLCERSRTADS